MGRKVRGENQLTVAPEDGEKALSSRQQVLMHPPATNELPLACDICGQSLSNDGNVFSASTLLMHKAKAHPAVATASKEAIQGDDAMGAKGNRGGRHHIKQKIGPRRKSSKPELYSRTGARFCPDCGCNLEVINAALSLSSGAGL